MVGRVGEQAAALFSSAVPKGGSPSFADWKLGRVLGSIIISSYIVILGFLGFLCLATSETERGSRWTP